MRYRPNDQVEKLGPPPWDPLDERLGGWERAHGHDVRLSCSGDRCLVTQGQGYEDGFQDGYAEGWRDAAQVFGAGRGVG